MGKKNAQKKGAVSNNKAVELVQEPVVEVKFEGNDTSKNGEYSPKKIETLVAQIDEKNARIIELEEGVLVLNESNERNKAGLESCTKEYNKVSKRLTASDKENEELREKVVGLDANLVSLKKELSDTKKELTNRDQQLIIRDKQLELTSNDLKKAKEKLVDTERALKATQNSYTVTNVALEQRETELNSAKRGINTRNYIILALTIIVLALLIF